MKRSASSTIVKVGLIQAACSANPSVNLKRTLAAVERAAQRGAKIICTQELFRSQYFCQSEDHDYFKLADAMAGAEILFYPTAIGWHPDEKAQHGALQHSAWETIQRSHAIANGCYVVVPNRIGHEKLSGKGIQFWGQSFVSGTSGQILARAA